MAALFDKLSLRRDILIYLDDYLTADDSNRRIRRSHLASACRAAGIDCDALLQDPAGALAGIPDKAQLLRSILPARFYDMYRAAGGAADHMKRLTARLAPEYAADPTRVAILKKALTGLGEKNSTLPTHTVIAWAKARLNADEKKTFAAADGAARLRLLADKLDDSIFALLDAPGGMDVTDTLRILVKRVVTDCENGLFADDTFACVDTSCLDGLLIRCTAPQQLLRSIPLIEKLLWIAAALQNGTRTAAALRAALDPDALAALKTDLAAALLQVSANGRPGAQNSLLPRFEKLLALPDAAAFLCGMAQQLHAERKALVLTNRAFLQTDTGCLDALLPQDAAALAALLPAAEKCALLHAALQSGQLPDGAAPDADAFFAMENAFIEVFKTVPKDGRLGICRPLYQRYQDALAAPGAENYSAPDALGCMLELLLEGQEQGILGRDALAGIDIRFLLPLFERCVFNGDVSAGNPAVDLLLSGLGFPDKLKLLQPHLTAENIQKMNESLNRDFVARLKEACADALAVCAPQYRAALEECLHPEGRRTLPAAGETLCILTEFFLSEQVYPLIREHAFAGRHFQKLNAAVFLCVPCRELFDLIPVADRLAALCRTVFCRRPLESELCALVDEEACILVQNSLARWMQSLPTRKTVVKESVFALYKTNLRDARKSAEGLRLLAFADELAAGVFRPNGITKTYLYYYAFLFGLSFSREEMPVSGEYDLEKQLFHGYYAENTLQTLLREQVLAPQTAKRLSTSFEDANKVLSRGINYKNFAEMCYLYCLVNPPAAGATAGEALDAAENMIESCCDLAASSKKLTPRTAPTDHTRTRTYRDKVSAFLSRTPWEAKKYLVESYVIRQDRRGAGILAAGDTNTAFELCANMRDITKKERQLMAAAAELMERLLLQEHSDDPLYCTLVRALCSRFSPSEGFLAGYLERRIDTHRITRSEFLILCAMHFLYSDEAEITRGTTLADILDNFCYCAEELLLEAGYQPPDAENLFDACVMFFVLLYTAAELPAEYRIPLRYDLRGGENPPQNPQSRNAEAETVILPPVRSGFRFAGWLVQDAQREYTAPAGSFTVPPYDFSLYTLTALWQKA